MLSRYLFFLIFIVFIVFMLALDLGVFHKKDHVIHVREAATWTAIWVLMAMLFAVLLFFHAEWIHGINSFDELLAYAQANGLSSMIDESMDYTTALDIYRHEVTEQYLAGYFLEEALSMDNIFVMIMIFVSFGIDKQYYHRVLFWGVLGAIVMRFIFIFTLGALVERFSLILAFFGVILIYSGASMIFKKDDKAIDTANHPVVKFASRHFRVSRTGDGHNFFINVDGHRYMTPLFLVLLIIECSDIIFAVDSIPAVFSVTTDKFIVFFSNIFAIMGLRSLFFLMSDIADRFWLLKYGLGLLLCFIGLKMIAHEFLHFEISTIVSLLSIIIILATSMLFSIIIPKRKASSN